MPPNNPHLLAVEAGIVALSAAIAAAVAIYESPELRRQADDVRRRIATALHQLGDGITPTAPRRTTPMFNRPEDAYAYWQGRAGLQPPDGPPGVDADDETRRRQREELMYWNAIREQRESERKTEFEADAAAAAAANGRPPPARGTSFDDFLQQDPSAGETGAYVFNSGTDYRPPTHGLVQRRGDGARVPELAPPSNNPFADSTRATDDEKSPPPSETVRDDETGLEEHTIPDTNTKGVFDATETLAASNLSMPRAETELPPTLERRLAENQLLMTGGNDDHDSQHDDPFASVQAWARDTQPAFYSPLPMSPTAPVSEPEIVSDFEGHEDGQLTPTDSVSLIGSSDDGANDAASSKVGEAARPYDVLSESEGMATPASWSDVGSVVSEGESWR